MMKDMTVGNPSKIILNYSIPIILSGMFQQFYNIADSLIAGKYAGVDALAAVGASYPITMLFVAVALGAGMGCSVIISQIFGSKEYETTKSAISTALISTLCLSLFLMFVGILANNSLMRLMNTPTEVFADGALYLRIYFLGLVFLFIYNMSTAVFNGLGDSKTPLYFLIFSSVFNIFLDYLFVAHFKMGVAGVAWATFIAQGLASVLAALTLIKRIKKFKVEHPERVKVFDGQLLKKMSRIAIPSIIQQSVVSVGNLFVQALVNGFGPAVIAGYAAAIKLDSFFKMVFVSLGNAISSYAAQNIGANKKERVKAGYFSALSIAGVYCVIVFVLVRFTGGQMIQWFISSDTTGEIQNQVLSVGTTYMFVVSATYIACALMLISCGLLRGVGHMKGFTIATMIDLFVRVAGAYLLAYVIGYNAIWWSISAGWSIGMLFAFKWGRVYLKKNLS